MLEWSTSTVGPVPADRYINLPWAKPSSYDHPGRQRFTDEEATKIRRAYWRGDETIAGLARRFGVTEVTISRIVHGLSYWWTC